MKGDRIVKIQKIGVIGVIIAPKIEDKTTIIPAILYFLQCSQYIFIVSLIVWLVVFLFSIFLNIVILIDFCPIS